MANDSLTPKQIAFCDEFMVDFNGTQAAIRAGYSVDSARSIASENLTKPNILARIDELVKERSDTLKVDERFVIDGFIEVYQRCMEKKPVMVWDTDNKCHVPLKKEDGGGVFQFDAMGANKALENIGKFLAMFTEKREISMQGLSIIQPGLPTNE